MTISIIIKGKNFSKSVGRLGLVHGPQTYRLFGISEAKSLGTRLYTPDIATVVGSGLTYDANSMTIGQPRTGGIVTESPYYGGVGSFTMFAVPKRILSSQVMIVGGDNDASAPQAGWGIQYVGGYFGVKTNAGQRLGTIAQNQGEGFAFIAVRGDAVSRQLTVSYYSLAGLVVATEVYGSYTVGAPKFFRAGAMNVNDNAYTIAAMGNYHRYLTDAELNDVYLQVKDDLGRRGVVIP